jgi:hypothetical protein
MECRYLQNQSNTKPNLKWPQELIDRKTQEILEKLKRTDLGRLTAVSFSHMKGYTRYYNLVCQDGNPVVASIHDLRGRKIRSCGCLQQEARRTNRLVHGDSKTDLHNIWCGLIDRATNTKSHCADRYVLAGIDCDPRWQGAEGYLNFKADLKALGMLPRPSRAFSLDRKDNTKGYYPDNVRWATDTQQARNTRNNRMLTYQNKTLCMAEWSERKGWGDHVIEHRLARGWTVEEALSIPVGIFRKQWHKQQAQAV